VSGGAERGGAVAGVATARGGGVAPRKGPAAGCLDAGRGVCVGGLRLWGRILSGVSGTCRRCCSRPRRRRHCCCRGAPRLASPGPRAPRVHGVAPQHTRAPPWPADPALSSLAAGCTPDPPPADPAKGARRRPRRRGRGRPTGKCVDGERRGLVPPATGAPIGTRAHEDGTWRDGRAGRGAGPAGARRGGLGWAGLGWAGRGAF
jgi:hypothetical protein